MKINLVALPWAWKGTKRAYKKILKSKMKNINNQEIKKQINLIINLNDKIYFRKSRSEYEGEIGEIDACKDYWINESYSHLHAVYDPIVKEIKALYLGKEETIKNILWNT